jgi:hypothetical protein
MVNRFLLPEISLVPVLLVMPMLNAAEKHAEPHSSSHAAKTASPAAPASHSEASPTPAKTHTPAAHTTTPVHPGGKAAPAQRQAPQPHEGSTSSPRPPNRPASVAQPGRKLPATNQRARGTPNVRPAQSGRSATNSGNTSIRVTGYAQPPVSGGIGGGSVWSGVASFHPPAGATARHAANGGMTYSHAGTSYNTDRNGRLSSVSRPGMETRYGSNGKVLSAHFDRPGGSQMNLTRGVRGERRIETVRDDHTRVVSWAPHAGYVERPLRPGYVSRTYMTGGRTYLRVYRTYSFRGVAYYGYVPSVHYGPRFYGWAWNPWPAPAAFTWGWHDSPWLGSYGGYFVPSPVYPTAALWLTDYLLAEYLQSAWENRQAAMADQQGALQDEPSPLPPAGPNGSVVLTPEIKQAIADEVKLQLAAEYAEANRPVPQAAPLAGNEAPTVLDPNLRIFVVSTSFAVNANGQDCDLTPGDIIKRTNNAMISARNTVNVTVLSSKPGDCPAKSAAEVDVATLQEMLNQFQDHVDSGLRVLADNQGKGGLPASPPPEAKVSPDGTAPEDSLESVDSALTRQQQDANQALQELQRETGSS